MKKNLIASLAFVVFLIACSAPIPATPAVIENSPPPATSTTMPIVDAPEQVTISFDPSDLPVQNPERGFTIDVDLDESDFSEYYLDGYTLAYFNIRLDEYRAGDLPSALLDRVDGWFSSARQAGVKAVIRFSYNDGPYPLSRPDASLERILSHIRQLQPVLTKNSDVLAWTEAGFIGAWGEWHTSTNGLDNDVDAKRRILFALLEALPPDRMILMRYPVDIMRLFPEPLTAEEAFSGSPQARVGFHNDCFLASADDEHTYGRDGVFSIEVEYEYLSQITRFTPVGGETCDHNPPRSDCPTALQEMELFHFSEISDDWHPDVLDAWEEQGCYAEIQNRLGYRFALTSVSVNQTAGVGGVLDLSVSLVNNGFASLINPRPVYVILDGPVRVQALLPVEPRFWQAGDEASFRARLRVPANLPEGTYRLALWMPDAYASLQADNRYAIRFANLGVWDEARGYNVLTNVTIGPFLNTVDADASADEFIVLP